MSEVHETPREAARDIIFRDFDVENDIARAQWGESFDVKNTLNDWAVYVGIYLARACIMENRGKPKEQRKALVKAGNLVVTAIKHLDAGTLADRHYENN